MTSKKPSNKNITTKQTKRGVSRAQTKATASGGEIKLREASNKFARLGVFFLLAIAASALIIWTINRSSDDTSSAQTTEQVVKSGTEIESQIREIFNIPEDETMTSLTHMPTQEARDDIAGKNPFLEDSEVGDYYAVFENRVFLYRDSNNQIINYAPIVRNN